MSSSDLSPYAAAASALFYSRAAHFAGAAEVWAAFFEKQISSKRREELLFVLRSRLAAEVPASK